MPDMSRSELHLLRTSYDVRQVAVDLKDHQERLCYLCVVLEMKVMMGS